MQLSMPMARVSTYSRLARPFTMIAPILGTISAATVALNTTIAEPIAFPETTAVIFLLNIAIVITLNTASNGINQIFDVEIDRINKPYRPLPAGQMSFREAWMVTIVGYLLALMFAALVNLTVFIIVILASLATIIYSVPPFRTKRSWFWANLTIAVTRGALLVMMGWSSFASVMSGEPWFIGLVVSFFIFGAATTKDFSDMEGDLQNGCLTLPNQVGIEKTVYLMAPFFTIPFAFIGLGSSIGVLRGNSLVLWLLSVTLIFWGGYTIWLILREPSKITAENHPSWRHMYTMMMTIYCGFMVAYLAI